MFQASFLGPRPETLHARGHGVTGSLWLAHGLCLCPGCSLHQAEACASTASWCCLLRPRQRSFTPTWRPSHSPRRHTGWVTSSSPHRPLAGPRYAGVRPQDTGQGTVQKVSAHGQAPPHAYLRPVPQPASLTELPGLSWGW